MSITKEEGISLISNCCQGSQNGGPLLSSFLQIAKRSTDLSFGISFTGPNEIVKDFKSIEEEPSVETNCKDSLKSGKNNSFAESQEDKIV